MSESKYIHETIIKDIVDMAIDFPEKGMDHLPGIFKTNGSTSYKSVMSGAEKLTLVFPVFCSSNISTDTAIIISKAIERKCVTMLQMLFSALQVQSKGTDAFDFLSNFHGNLDSGELNVDSFIDSIDKFAANQESANLINVQEAVRMIKEDMKNIDYTLPDTVNESSLNDITVNHTNGKTVLVREADSLGKALKDYSDFTDKQVVKTDINKANELLPSLMIVNFMTKDKQAVAFVAGVKAKLYPIDSNDIVNRIMLKNKDNNGLTKFIRATTREISFWKDFVFAIDKAKIDALSSGKRGSSSKIWKILERRAKIGNLKRFFGMKNDAAAISTLVISKNDVDQLKNQYDIDVEQPKVIRPIMESYSLMGFVIADESTEIAKFIFDTGDDNYEMLPFRSLERDASDTSYKKIINLMSKISH